MHLLCNMYPLWDRVPFFILIRDCLLVNEAIEGISDFSTSIEGSTLSISFVANTIYGDVSFQGQEAVRAA